MRKINFDRVEEFDRDCIKLSKRKCKTLLDDLETIKKALRVKIPEHQSTKRINDLGELVKIPIYKVRRFRCRAIKKGSYSGFRLIYAYIEDSSTITFIQFYHKDNEKIENRKRIYKYFKEKEI
jgi:mRNA-degrading endonuclease RelE of RelBE toxin-antitoxin system